MKSKTITLLFLLFIIGCASIDKIHQDYARINIRDGVSEKEAILMAQMHILNEQLENQYKVLEPKVDHYPGMPEGRDYVFILFDQSMTEENIDRDVNEVYLVIINPLFGAIAYAGVFDPTKGNYHYRYLNIIRDIQNKITVPSI